MLVDMTLSITYKGHQNNVATNFYTQKKMYSNSQPIAVLL